MSRKGNSYNGILLWSLKSEMFYGFEKEFSSIETFKLAISDYIDYYNNNASN